MLPDSDRSQLPFDPTGLTADALAAETRSRRSRRDRDPSASLVNDRRWQGGLLVALAVLLLGGALEWAWLGLMGAIALIVLSVPIIFPPLRRAFLSSIFGQRIELLFCWLLLFVGVGALLQFAGVLGRINRWSEEVNWSALGAVGQIAIAVVALWVAWQQVRTSVQLTSQQNRITQQQTIDAYFQGISDLVLNDEGLLEDWPLERAIAAGRTAAILRGADPANKARVLRFLSVSNLLSPLKRDGHLGRPILDGKGWYLRDRVKGVRVVDLGAILAGTDLSYTDLRGIDLSDINLSDADLRGSDLSYANLVMTNLMRVNLTGADVGEANLFVRNAKTASPYRRGEKRNFKTGECTGALVKGANFTGATLSEEIHYYVCAWGGERTRRTVPGGCGSIPNKLEASETEASEIETVKE
ncbi:pentapeptide repeat-containing protein [Synechococcus sp. PCC 7336]|uniref:pentapeptide repeat-containing protein n=1 Tax=Synechococcus sp. PCC 7336 TaxID=195250 RepID=UPI0003488A66|nr:pentapeptide repeat-containing protein [Synechococcus sp. PCC 7336]